jgi:RNA polymerase sigma factor (sigma-70 family)
VAYRMLGSVSEADDAVQEAWLRLARSDTSEVENLAAWLTTVVSRICLDQLRSRGSRRESALPEHDADEDLADPDADPVHDAVLADQVGSALQVVLDTLSPAERLAFVLHDLFALPFEEVGSVMGRSSAAVRQLASRGRRRVQASDDEQTTTTAERRTQRQVVEAFLSASRSGDLQGLMELLDPGAVVRPTPPRSRWAPSRWSPVATRWRALSAAGRRGPDWRTSTGMPAWCGRWRASSRWPSASCSRRTGRSARSS